MAHEITATDNVVLAKRSAWHGLGTVVEEAPTVAGAIQLAGLDWEVEAWPLSATDGDRKVAVGTHVLNVRSDTKAPLGVVGEGYVPLQNTELGGFAEQLMGVGVRIESAGSLRGGKRVWMLCRTEEVVEFGRNGDDRVVPYILLANGHDGALAFTVQPTTVRVAPTRGRPYQHRCQLDTFEAVAHAIDEAGDAGFVLEELVAAEDLPSSQAATAVAFMKERGCVTTEGRRSYAASGSVHLDAMIEYHAMRHEFTGAGRGENG